jgi:hypothetical protein
LIRVSQRTIRIEKRKDLDEATDSTVLRNIALELKDPVIIIFAPESNKSDFNICEQHLSERQQHTALLVLAVELYSVSVLYRRLLSTSNL